MLNQNLPFTIILLLALDSATTTASLAVYNLETDQLLGEWTWQARRRQTQDMLVAAQNLLTQLGLSPQQLTALAVTTGPGSFTGVRIAISAAKGIGIGLSTPPQTVGIPVLSVTAAPWLSIAHSQQPAPIICAYIRAGRGRYNWVLFHDNNPLRRPDVADHQAGDAAQFAEALADLPSQPIWLIGEQTEDIVQSMAPLTHVTLVDEISSLRRAGQLARLASLHLKNGINDGLSQLQPLYLQS